MNIFLALIGCGASLRDLDDETKSHVCDEGSQSTFAQDYYQDEDGDSFGSAFKDSILSCVPVEGYSLFATDCDDDDAARFPGALDVCDGVDNDCDEIADNDDRFYKTVYADTDHDGFGNNEVALSSCEVEMNYSEVAGDCDDTNQMVFPGTLDVCDGVDNDCDGQIDNEPLLFKTFYRDRDGDGFGVTNQVQQSCFAPVQFSDRDGDCDDRVNTVHPDAVERCDGIDNNCDGVTDINAVDVYRLYLDLDQDGFGDPAHFVPSCDEDMRGFVADATDCDDDSSSIHPQATELCDALDNNCDGVIDDDAVDRLISFLDADGDGFGGVQMTEDCDIPDHHVMENGDCHDGDAEMAPGLTEICDDKDNDCNDLIDDEAIDRSVWYFDFDEDTFGDGTAETILDCEQPEGYVLQAGDCDDLEFFASPSNQVEVCDGQAIDDDCDPQNNETCNLPQTGILSFDGTTLEGASIVISGSSENQRLGVYASIADVNGDFVNDVTIFNGIYEDEFGVRYPGALYSLFADQQTGFTTLANQSPIIDTNQIRSGLVSGVVIEGDSWFQSVNGFSVFESQVGSSETNLLIGTVSQDPNASPSGSRGIVKIVDPSTHFSGVKRFSELDHNFVSANLFVNRVPNLLGANVQGMGDFDGDGINDYMFSEPLSLDEQSVYVIKGQTPLDTLGDNNVDQLVGTGFGYRFRASGNHPTLGQTLTSADLNEDGLSDIVVGESEFNNGKGRVWVLYGNENLPSIFSTEDCELDLIPCFTLTGQNSEGLGYSIATGDVNGDGHQDLVIGNYNSSQNTRGSVRVIYAQESTGGFSGHLNSNQVGDPESSRAAWPGVIIRNEDQTASDDASGYRVSSADVNQDGFDDVLFLSPSSDRMSSSIALQDQSYDGGDLSVFYGHSEMLGNVSAAGAMAPGQGFRNDGFFGDELGDFIGVDSFLGNAAPDYLLCSATAYEGHGVCYLIQGSSY